MRKLRFEARTLDDAIIRDGLCAVGALDNHPESKDNYFLVGGIATQGYLPTSCRRPTADIDLALLKPLTHEQFHQFSAPVKTYLNDHGYSFETRKGQNSYMIMFFKSADQSEQSSAAAIEFARKSPDNFSRMEVRLHRERDHARRKIVEGRDMTYVVSSPEDIAVPKIVRSVSSLKRNPHFKKYVYQYCRADKPLALSPEEIRNSLEEIGELRQEATMNLGDTRLAESLRFVSDMYDIRLLSEVVGFNENYLSQAMSEWNNITENVQERELLLNCLLPSFSTTHTL